MAARLAVVAADDAKRARLCSILANGNYEVEEHSSASTLAGELANGRVGMVVLAADGIGSDWEGAIRTVSETGIPLLVVAPVQDEALVIRVLKLGADGCLCEPFGDAELLARVEAHLRRQWDWTYPISACEDDRLRLSALTRSAFLHGRWVRLSVTEYRLLSKLLENEGRVVPRDELFEHVWGCTGAVTASALRLCIHNLRKKLEPNPETPRFIRTEWGVGYRLSADGSDPKS